MTVVSKEIGPNRYRESFGRYFDDFTLQNARRRRNFFRFKSITKMILPYKMRTVGDFLWFMSVTYVILPYKMRAAGDFFCGLCVLLR